LNWDAVGAFAELAGALGIVVSLVYLATQLRQNSALLKASMASATREAGNALTSSLAGDREALRVFWAGLDDRDSLEQLDRQQFDALLSLWFENLLQGYRNQDPDSLERFNWGIGRKGVHQWWALYATAFPPDFRDYMNARMASITSAV
jgi:hypothetical protein